MKKILAIGIILILLLPVLTRADKGPEDLEILRNMLKDMDADFYQGDIVINGVILDKFLGEEEINELGKEVLSKLEIVGKETDPLIKSDKKLGDVYYREVIFEDDYSQLNFQGYDRGGNLISIYLSSYLYDNNLRGETYLCINIIKEDAFFEINGIIENVESIFKRYDKVMETTSCLIGTIEGKQVEKRFEKKLKKVIKEMKGNIIEEYRDDMILSYTIYTPKIEKSLTMGEKKINLNLAMRYNEYEDTTYLWVATPIITIGY